jgi:adenine-specific DNA-methyltransferase
MAQWLLEDAPTSVLDPGAGGGNLLQPFADAGVALSAADIDPDLRRVLAARFPGIELFADFWEIDDARRFDAVVANPPYIAHAKIQNKEALHERLLASTGVALPRTTNLAALCYLHCWSLLAEGGRMLFLMPTEFMQTKSGVAFKRFLISGGHCEHIVDLADGGLFGAEVVSTACLVLARKAEPPTSVIFSAHNGRPPFPTWTRQARSGRALPHTEIDVRRRWRPDRRRSVDDGKTQALGELCDVRPGLITGNNNFFLRSWPELVEKGLEQAAVYCLIRPHQLPTPFFHTPEQIQALKVGTQKRWLIAISDKPNAQERAFLRAGEAVGAHARATQKARHPWWRQTLAAPCDFAISNFRRRDYLLTAYSTDTQLLERMPFAVVPNLVYVRPQFSHLREVVFAYLVSASGQEALRGDERHAGNGLFTLRAGALKEVRLPLLQNANADWREQMMAALLRLRVAALALVEADLAEARVALDEVAAALALALAL